MVAAWAHIHGCRYASENTVVAYVEFINDTFEGTTVPNGTGLTGVDEQQHAVLAASPIGMRSPRMSPR